MLATIVTTIQSLDTKTLLAVYNKVTGKSTSRFASREDGQTRTLAAIEREEFTAQDVNKFLKQVGSDVRVEFKEAISRTLAEEKKVTLSPGEVFKGDFNKKKAKKSDTKELFPETKKKVRLTNLAAVPGKPVACRQGSKQSLLVDLLNTPQGATLAELMAAMSGGKKPWTEASVRAGFGWDLKQKGYGVKSSLDENGVERFRLVLPEGFQVPPHRPLKKETKNV